MSARVPLSARLRHNRAMYLVIHLCNRGCVDGKASLHKNSRFIKATKQISRRSSRSAATVNLRLVSHRVEFSLKCE
jgi:hypothetical protein